MKKESRFQGSLLGLAAGDALGTTLEFKPPKTFQPLTDIVGGGPFRLNVGEWTDDTSMALCLAQSLIENNGTNLKDQLEKYVKWYQEGYMSSNGECFDIGVTTRQALEKFILQRSVLSGSTNPQFSGNGSLMRLAPVPLFYNEDFNKAVQHSSESSMTTHGSYLCVDSCRYYAGLIVGAINGYSKEELLSTRFSMLDNYWETHPLCPEIDAVARGSYKNSNPPTIQGSGFVVKSMEAALWAFYNAKTFEEGALKAVNLGDDADTTGAIYGQLAGAYYGIEGIPQNWQDKLVQKELILGLANQLFEKSQVEQNFSNVL